MRKAGRKGTFIDVKVKRRIFKDYDDNVLTIAEILNKYRISRYMFYKIIKTKEDR